MKKLLALLTFATLLPVGAAAQNAAWKSSWEETLAAAREEGKVVIFAAGTGNPFFTTDTAAALRGAEIGAQIVLKATKVDGVYSADPMTDATAELFNEITYRQVLERQLKEMDASAISLCMDNNLPIIIFNMREAGNIRRVVTGERGVGTKVG